MVRLASILHNGKTKLVAEISGGFCDLSSIASNARDFFGVPDGVERANALIAGIPSDSPHTSREFIPIDALHDDLAPIDGSLVGKFLCIGMNYVVGKQNHRLANEEKINPKIQVRYQISHNIVLHS